VSHTASAKRRGVPDDHIAAIGDESRWKDTFPPEEIVLLELATRLCHDAHDVPAELIEEQKRLFAIDAERDGRPAGRIPEIVEGRLNKWLEAICLLEQPYRDTDQKIADLINEKVALLGENIRVARFSRMGVGETAPTETDEAA